MMAWLAPAAHAACLPEEETALACAIDGRAQEVAVCIAGEAAIYRYGAPGAAPELTLEQKLTEVGYLRALAPTSTWDETVIFASGDYSYAVTAGFRSNPDDTAMLRKIVTLTVSKDGAALSRLECRPEGMRRDRDLLGARMVGAGREHASNGATISVAYPVHRPGPAAESACAQADNIDACWSEGFRAANDGDLGNALVYYDLSCETGFDVGCYEAGKLYLQNRDLRDYPRARDRFRRVCEGDDPGIRPYACKYLGWMSLTGIGAARDLDEAWNDLFAACFPVGDGVPTIDPEGCHFLAEAIDGKNRTAPAENAGYLGYVALAMGCTDYSEGVCEEARARIRSEKARRAPWIVRCDEDVREHRAGTYCEGLASGIDPSSGSAEMRRLLLALYWRALRYPD